MRGSAFNPAKVALVVLATIFLQAASVYAQASRRELEEHLQQQLKGRVFTLRGFPEEAKIEYSKDGIPQTTIHSGPWTLAKIEVTRIKVKDDDIEISGNRVALWYDKRNKELQNRRTEHSYNLKIHSGAATVTQLDQLLANVFILSAQELISQVPEFWRPYLSGKVISDPKNKPPLQIMDWPQSKERVYTMAEGAEPPKPLHTPDPEYSEWQRSFKAEGFVNFAVVIAKDGTVQDIAVAQPQGLGFDELAAEAIRTWTFKPGMLHGNPVPVQVEIEVSFNYY